MIEIIFDYNKVSDIKDKLPVFATIEYLSYKSDIYGWFKSDDFILPFYVTKRLIFNRMFFTTQTINLTENTSIEDEKYFLNQIVILAKINNIDCIDVPQVNSIFRVCPEKSKYIEFGTYIVDLKNTDDQLFKNLHQKHRNVIRKAEKDGVIIKSGDCYIEDCYKIIKETYKRQDKNFIDFDSFKKLNQYLKDNVSFYVAKKDNITQGCAVLLWNKGNSCYYLYGGSIKTPYTGSLNLLHWKAMMDMKNNGVLSYDFFGARMNVKEGSKLEGIQRFKERFGGNLRTGYLWKYPIKKYKYCLFKIIYKINCMIKRIKYEGDIIDITHSTDYTDYSTIRTDGK